MKIGIIGSSKFDEKHKDKISEVAKLVVELGYEIVIVPEENSLPHFFAKEYLKEKGKKVYSVIPLDDDEFGNDWVTRDIGELVNCGTWRNQPEKLNEESDILISFGYCTGGVIEICYSKWFGKNKIYILEDFISSKLPTELEKDLDLRYVSVEKLEEELNSLKF